VDSLYASESKKNAQNEGAVIVYEDEASFRQTPTLYRTWARRGQQPQIPTRGERHTQKVLGAVSVPEGDLVWRHQTEYFNAQTYLSFVDQELLPHYYRRGHRVYLIKDNASYHKKPEVWEYFAQHRRQVEVFLLPPYSPEFNAQEPLWHYTRMHGTHNRYFDTPAALCQSLFTTFIEIQEHPERIRGLIAPFF
jgi:transposase